MKNILLACAAGMSTSMLVKRMQDVAGNKGIEVQIKAIPESEVSKYIDNADIILLGPQVRFMQSKIKSLVGNIPVEVIDMASYGTMNGEKVLMFALEKIGGLE